MLELQLAGDPSIPAEGGSNAFGVKKKITRRQTLSLWVDIEARPPGVQCFVPVGMSRGEAEKNTRAASWALIGTLIPPYVDSHSVTVTPTIDSPFEDDATDVAMGMIVEEVIAFDARTGRVFYRRGWDAQPTPVEKAMRRCASETPESNSLCRQKVADCYRQHTASPAAFHECAGAL